MWAMNPSQYSLSLMAFYVLPNYDFHLVYVAKLLKRIHYNNLKSTMDFFKWFLILSKTWRSSIFPSDIFKRVKQQVHSWVGVCTRKTAWSFAVRIDSHNVKLSVQSQKGSTKSSQRENISPKESLYVDKHWNNVLTNHYS